MLTRVTRIGAGKGASYSDLVELGGPVLQRRTIDELTVLPMVEVVVPLDLLSTRDSTQKSWQPASGRHTITVARFAGDPAGASTTVDL